MDLQKRYKENIVFTKVSVSSKTTRSLPSLSPREQSEYGFDKWMNLPIPGAASLLAIASSVVGENLRITGKNSRKP